MQLIRIKSSFLKILLTLCFVLSAIANAQEQSGSLTVEDIEFIGLRRTRPVVITRHLTFDKGSVISPEIIEENYQRLLATNFFKEVIFSTRPGSARGKLIVVIDVRERVWPVLEFAGGFTELDGWYLSPLGIRAYNTPGSGQSIGARMIIGDRVAGLNLNWHHPDLFASGVDFRLDIDGLGRDIIHYFDGREVLHHHNTGVLRLSFSGHRGLGRYLTVGYSAGNVKPDSSAKFTSNDSSFANFPSIIQKDLGQKKFNSFWFSLQADTRDNAIFPRKGFWGAISVEAADREFGSEMQFTRWIVDARFFGSRNRGAIAALHLKAAKISDSAPYYERFYLGGANSLRGFPERSLTPVGWGTELLLGSFEIRVPLSRRQLFPPPLSAALFIESGAIGTPEQRINRKSFQHAAGFGVRLKLPLVGVLRMDFAYPLDKEDFKFHVSLGQTF